MKYVKKSGILTLFAVLFVSLPVWAAKYFLVEEQLAKVYKDLDPKSPLIKQVKKGEYLDLIYDGTSWNKVMIDGQEGWIERRAGKIVDRREGVSIAAILLFLIIAGGAVGGSIYYIQKSRAPAMAKVDEF